MKALKVSLLSVTAVAFVGSQAQAGDAAKSANSANSTALLTAGASAATAAVLKPPCFAPGGTAACVMMGLAVVQTGLSLATAGGAKQSASQLTGLGDSYAGVGGVNNADPSSTYKSSDGTVLTGDAARTANALAANGLGGLADSYAKSSKALDSTGIKISGDGQTVTLPNGRKVSSSSMGSPDGMRNAGFSNAEISNAMNALNDVPKAVAAVQSKIQSLTNDVGGGGGGLARAGAGGGGSDANADLYARMMKGAKAGDKGVGVSGLSKKFGNDNIGVEGDNIFEMVSRRYQSKDKVDTFLKN